MLDVKEYPQLYLVDYQGMGEHLIFKSTTKSFKDMIAQIKNGMGQKQINVLRGSGFFKGTIEGLIQLRNRLITTIMDDTRFGLILVILNLLFIVFSWRVSGWVSHQVLSIVFQDDTDLSASKRSN